MAGDHCQAEVEVATEVPGTKLAEVVGSDQALPLLRPQSRTRPDYLQVRGQEVVKLCLPFPNVPVGARLLFFKDQWPLITSDQWVLELIEKGVFTGIHRFTTPVSRGAKNNVTIKARRNSKNRSLDPTSKECHSRSAKISPKSRVLQHLIDGSQEKFSKIETGHQSQTPESILGQEIIQNGSLKGHDKSNEARGLGSVHRSVRCLHAYTNLAKSSENF